LVEYDSADVLFKAVGFLAFIFMPVEAGRNEAAVFGKKLYILSLVTFVRIILTPNTALKEAAMRRCTTGGQDSQ
jgi:hypothetical protein